MATVWILIGIQHIDLLSLAEQIQSSYSMLLVDYVFAVAEQNWLRLCMPFHVVVISIITIIIEQNSTIHYNGQNNYKK